jgi:hypothetical protein
MVSVEFVYRDGECKCNSNESLSFCISAPKRALGPAELLLEASFTDMRHGGDGDLTQAYKFAKKVRPN